MPFRPFTTEEKKQFDEEQKIREENMRRGITPSFRPIDRPIEKPEITPEPEEKPSFFKRFLERGRRAVEEIKAPPEEPKTPLGRIFAGIRRRGEEVAEIREAPITPPEKVFRATGQVVGVVSDVIGEAISNIPGVEQGIEKLGKFLLDEEKPFIPKKLQTEAIEFAGNVLEKWENLKETNPRLAGNLQATGQWAEFLIDLGALKGAKSVSKNLFKKIVSKGDDLLRAAEPVFEKAVPVVKEAVEVAGRFTKQQAKKVKNLFPHRSVNDIASNILGTTSGVVSKEVAQETKKMATKGLFLIFEKLPEKRIFKKVVAGFEDLAKKGEDFQKEIGNRIGIELKRIERFTKKSDTANEALDGLLKLGNRQKVKSFELKSNIRKWEKLLEKNKTTGLTPAELNDLKIEWSKYFRLFTKGGAEATGFSPEIARQVRQDLRREVEGLFREAGLGDAKIKGLNQNWAEVDDALDFINRQVLARENALASKVKQSLITKITDLVSKIPFVKGSRQALQVFINTSQKGVNVLDIEKNLSKLIKELRKAGAKDEAIQEFIKSSMGAIDEQVNLINEELLRIGTRKALPEPRFIPQPAQRVAPADVEALSRQLTDRINEQIRRNEISKARGEFLKQRIMDERNMEFLDDVARDVERGIDLQVSIERKLLPPPQKPIILPPPK